MALPVRKYAEDRLRKAWQDRNLRVEANGAGTADLPAPDAKRSKAAVVKSLLNGAPVKRLLAWDGVQIAALPAPAVPNRKSDVALAAIAEASSGEARLCGTIAAGDVKIRHRKGGAGKPSFWAALDASENHLNVAQAVPQPHPQTRYWSYCTAAALPTGPSASDAAKLRAFDVSAKDLATAFCAATHNMGLAHRLRLEEWWNAQVALSAAPAQQQLPGAALPKPRSSMSAAIAARIHGGAIAGLYPLDCGALLEPAAPAEEDHVPELIMGDNIHPGDVHVSGGGDATAGAGAVAGGSPFQRAVAL